MLIWPPRQPKLLKKKPIALQMKLSKNRSSTKPRNYGISLKKTKNINKLSLFPCCSACPYPVDIL